MSTHRINPAAGWTSGKRLAGCRHCTGALPTGRRSFCSDACVSEWKIRSDPGHVRYLVAQRDQGVCALCRLPMDRLLAQCQHLRYHSNRRELATRDQWQVGRPQFPGRSATHLLEQEAWLRFVERQGPARGYFGDTGQRGVRWMLCRLFGIPNEYRSTWYDVDHEIPVVEGGGECGLSGYRTLCCACHRGVTAELRRRLAAKNQRAKARATTPLGSLLFPPESPRSPV